MRESLSVPRTLLDIGWKMKTSKGHKDERDTELMGQEWVVHPAF